MFSQANNDRPIVNFTLALLKRSKTGSLSNIAHHFATALLNQVPTHSQIKFELFSNSSTQRCQFYERCVRLEFTDVMCLGHLAGCPLFCFCYSAEIVNSECSGMKNRYLISNSNVTSAFCCVETNFSYEGLR